MFDFPSSPTEGQTFTPPGGPRYVFRDSAWRAYTSPIMTTALARNRIVNGAFQISQETVKGSVLTAAGAHIADQWQLYYGPYTSGNPGAATISNRGAWWGRLTSSTAAGTVAGAYMMLQQNVEGIRVADFRWGSADALPVVLAFRASSTIAGTFAVAIRNAPANRSYVALCTLAQASTPQDFVVPIPGDVAGTWAVDNALGLSVSFCTSAFTKIAPGVWTAGSAVGAVGMSDWASAPSQMLDITNVGLYLDPDGTGLPPDWEMPDEAEELQACRRYWHKIPATQASSPFGAGVCNAATEARVLIPLLVPKRVAPTFAFSAAADFQVAAVSAITASAITGINQALEAVTVSCTIAGATAGQGCFLRAANANAWISVNARM